MVLLLTHSKSEDIMIQCDLEAELRFLSLDELGQVLQDLSNCKDLPCKFN